jgi:hypothetical protein
VKVEPIDTGKARGASASSQNDDPLDL